MRQDKVNPVLAVQQHLSKLEKAHVDTEELCTQCGDCCHATLHADNGMVVVPELPCRFLAVKSVGTYHCTVYEDRFHVAPWCRDLMTGMLTGAYPVTCNYTKGFNGYVGGQVLSDKQYELLRPSLQKAIRATLEDPEVGKEFRKCFHAEDIRSFLDEGDLSKSMAAVVADIEPDEWLDLHYPQLSPRVRKAFERKLGQLIPERSYFSGLADHDYIQSYVARQSRRRGIQKAIENIVPSLCRILQLEPTKKLQKAQDVVLAYTVSTERAMGVTPQLLNRWLLEKAVDPETLAVVIDSEWYRDDSVDPRSMEALVLGKALDLAEIDAAGIKVDDEVLFEDLQLFKAVASLPTGALPSGRPDKPQVPEPEEKDQSAQHLLNTSLEPQSEDGQEQQQVDPKPYFELAEKIQQQMEVQGRTVLEQEEEDQVQAIMQALMGPPIADQQAIAQYFDSGGQLLRRKRRMLPQMWTGDEWENQPLPVLLQSKPIDRDQAAQIIGEDPDHLDDAEPMKNPHVEYGKDFTGNDVEKALNFYQARGSAIALHRAETPHGVYSVTPHPDQFGYRARYAGANSGRMQDLTGRNIHRTQADAKAAANEHHAAVMAARPARQLEPCPYGGGQNCRRHGGNGANRHYEGYRHNPVIGRTTHGNRPIRLSSHAQNFNARQHLDAQRAHEAKSEEIFRRQSTRTGGSEAEISAQIYHEEMGNHHYYSRVAMNPDRASDPTNDWQMAQTHLNEAKRHAAYAFSEHAKRHGAAQEQQETSRPKPPTEDDEGNPLVPCPYGGGLECAKHGGDGAEAHRVGYMHGGATYGPLKRPNVSYLEDYKDTLGDIEYREREIAQFFENSGIPEFDVNQFIGAAVPEGCRISDMNVHIDTYSTSGELGISASFEDMDGARVGSASRILKFDGDNVTVYHASMFLNENQQGKGYAETAYKKLFNFYKKIGVKYVSLQADGDVGWYAWAKKGFDFQPDSRESTLEEWRNHLRGWLAANRLRLPPGASIDDLQHSWDFMCLEAYNEDGTLYRGKVPNTLRDMMGNAGKVWKFTHRGDWYARRDVNAELPEILSNVNPPPSKIDPAPPRPPGVLGETREGNTIHFDSYREENNEGWTRDEHEDAANLHGHLQDALLNEFYNSVGEERQRLGLVQAYHKYVRQYHRNMSWQYTDDARMYADYISDEHDIAAREYHGIPVDENYKKKLEERRRKRLDQKQRRFEKEQPESRVIGRTNSGRPVFVYGSLSNLQDDQYTGWTVEDHRDAADAHKQREEELKREKADLKSKDANAWFLGNVSHAIAYHDFLKRRHDQFVHRIQDPDGRRMPEDALIERPQYLIDSSMVMMAGDIQHSIDRFYEGRKAIKTSRSGLGRPQHEPFHKLGKTSSGKPVYLNSYEHHDGWTPEDHEEASEMHYQMYHDADEYDAQDYHWKAREYHRILGSSDPNVEAAKRYITDSYSGLDVNVRHAAREAAPGQRITPFGSEEKTKDIPLSIQRRLTANAVDYVRTLPQVRQNEFVSAVRDGWSSVPHSRAALQKLKLEIPGLGKINLYARYSHRAGEWTVEAYTHIEGTGGPWGLQIESRDGHTLEDARASLSRALIRRGSEKMVAGVVNQKSGKEEGSKAKRIPATLSEPRPA